MTMNYENINELLSNAEKIIVLQADNPDGDSLGSSLALEAILNEMGKKVTMVCNVDMSAHLKYLNGWDRVQKEIPKDFDATIIVDTSTESLFENTDNGMQWIKTKPVIVLDHHTTSSGISFADISIIEPVVATGELIHKIAVTLGWPLPLDACEMLATSIMSDSLGLTTDSTTPDSYRVMADLIERGVEIAKLEASRREMNKKSRDIVEYKGRLLQRIEYDAEGQLASITIPWAEIEKYSSIYNPTILAMDDMRLVENVKIAIGYKLYPDGRITAKIRCNYGSPIASKLAENFGGGGHPYAAGFKVTDGSSFNQVKSKVNNLVSELLKKNLEEI